eukprot:gnl/TRDRNA2_/TRDRNA2_170198_c3_seq2.p1 gnl/TRDRNA2_/TRDRNA2_170198_c3~~gnl/TRDRNA2_/TRDRNA2_170198_c3_seq2.p1  ORF type:complete len:141 (+),score=19.01 gnl/TRDRNA2_/TRDRNA2_170198_c3_seq2:219-641(+)
MLLLEGTVPWPPMAAAAANSSWPPASCTTVERLSQGAADRDGRLRARGQVDSIQAPALLSHSARGCRCRLVLFFWQQWHRWIHGFNACLCELLAASNLEGHQQTVTRCATSTTKMLLLHWAEMFKPSDFRCSHAANLNSR